MRHPLLIAALSLLGGCAQLNVEVDVIEPRYASAAALDAGLRIEAADIATSPHGLSDAFLSRAFGSYYHFRDDCIDELVVLVRAAREATQDGTAARSIQDSNIATLAAAKSNHSRLEEATRDLHRLDDAVMTAIAAAPPEAAATRTPRALSGTLRAALLARRAQITSIETDLRESVRGQTEGEFNCRVAAQSFATDTAAPQQARDQAAQVAHNQDPKAAEAERTIHAAAQATITGSGILLNNSLEAFYITNAPDSVWGRRYNRAFGGGMFGSTSIAIVMNQTADFSVKGFVFDGRSTAQMVSKVGVQALSLIAAAHGAPINLRQTPAATGSPAQFDVAQQVSVNRATVERAEAEQEAYNTSLLRIAESVMSNWGGLTAANQSPVSRDIVSGTVSAYRTSWQTPAPRQ